jgi:hypothetical protein
MRKGLIGVVSLVVISIIFYLIYISTQQKPANTPPSNVTQEITPLPSPTPDKAIQKATFLIFTNNTRRIFTDPRYHHKSESVYITKEQPTQVTVTKEGITWNDLFKTLPMSVTNECLITGTQQTFCSNATHTLKFYINGEKVENGLDTDIHEGDTLLISYGPTEDPQIQQQLKELSSL